MSNAGLIVDNFAGGGGASLGIEWAMRRPIDIAINHSPEAIAMHRANHPETYHYTTDIWEVDPIEATRGRRVELAWFSPDCRHFSKAKGGRPVSPKVRGLAWVVVRWARDVRPSVICLENVEEFQTWGPLDRNGTPDKSKRGQTYREWIGTLEALGYRVESRELRACDYGAPTSRKRLFVIARCDGQPIVWPGQTHGPGLHPYRTAAECIDWSIPCPSIFERRKPLAENTLRRIARGIQRYVIEAADPFIVSLTHNGADRVESLSEPMRTVTGAHRGEKALVSAFLQTYYGEKRSTDFRGANLQDPLPTQPTENRFGLVTPFLAKHYGGVVGHGVTRPIGTVTAVDHHSLVAPVMIANTTGNAARGARDPLKTITTGDHHYLAAPFLAKLYGTCNGASVDAPMPTVTATGNHIAEVRAFLVKYYGTARAGQSITEPIDTITAKARYGLVTIAGIDYQIVDIGMRMLQPRELFRAQGFPDSYIIDPEFNGRPLTKTAQIKLCGNSVCPRVAEAIVRANCGKLAKKEAAA